MTPVVTVPLVPAWLLLLGTALMLALLALLAVTEKKRSGLRKLQKRLLRLIDDVAGEAIAVRGDQTVRLTVSQDLAMHAVVQEAGEMRWFLGMTIGAMAGRVTWADETEAAENIRVDIERDVQRLREEVRRCREAARAA